jgi:hypothetical protein
MRSFRRLTAVLFLVSLIALPPLVLQARAQSQDKAPDQLRTLSRDELDIIKVLTMQENAWNRGDIGAYATGYRDSPDTLFIGRQVSRGYQAMLNDYKQNYPNRDAMGTLSFSDLEPHLLDDHFAVAKPAAMPMASSRSSSRRPMQDGRSSWTTPHRRGYPRV